MEKTHMEVLLEDIRGKFDLVLEGHDALRGEIRELGRKTEERFDLVDFKIDTLNQKIDGVAADLKATDERLSGKLDAVVADLKATDERLSGKLDAVAADLTAHRADTEVHRQVWQVREDGP
jgi:outer membrane murein-binding lipoprotein Lpp